MSSESNTIIYDKDKMCMQALQCNDFGGGAQILIDLYITLLYKLFL